MNVIRATPRVLPAILTLAAGVAACSTVFTLADSLLFRPLPFPQPSQLAALKGATHGKEPSAVSWQDVRDVTSAVSPAAAYLPRTWGYSDATGQPLEVVLSAMATERFFDVLKVPARLQPQSIWLTHKFWKQRYQSNLQAVGQTVALNDEKYRVAGVLPEWFIMPLQQDEPSVVILLDEKSYCCERTGRTLQAIARFTEGGGDAALAALSHQLAKAYPESNRDFQLQAVDLQQEWAGDRRRPMLLLLCAVALLMLVAAANAGGMLLARASATARDAAIKTSLGASASSLAVDRIMQGLAIGVAAGPLGLLGALSILAIAKQVPLIADSIENYQTSPDFRIAAFAIAIGVAAAIAASLLPLIALRPKSLERMLRDGGVSSSPSKSIVRVRFILLAAQFALTVLLLSTGGILLRHLQTILAAERGLCTDQVVLAGIGIPESRYNTDEKMIAFHQQVISNLKQIPGVLEVGGGSSLPVGAMRSRFRIAGQPPVPVNERPRTAVAVASPEMFSLLQIPILRGQGFAPQDRYGAPLKVLVSEMFVSKFLTGVDPIGKVIQLGFYNGSMKPWMDYQIAGVTADTRNRGIGQPGEPQVYLSANQIPLEGFLYFARTSRDAASLVSEFREAVWQVDRNIQAITPRPLAQHVEQRLVQSKLALLLIGAFALFSLLFAASGLAAGMSASISESRKEIAIRAALGANPASLLARIIRRGMQVALCGFALGIAATVGASHWIASLLTDAPPLDLSIACAVGLVLTLTALAACLRPAIRASRTDPAQVLRQ